MIYLYLLAPIFFLFLGYLSENYHWVFQTQLFSALVSFCCDFLLSCFFRLCILCYSPHSTLLPLFVFISVFLRTLRHIHRTCQSYDLTRETIPPQSLLYRDLWLGPLILFSWQDLQTNWQEDSKSKGCSVIYDLGPMAYQVWTFEIGWTGSPAKLSWKELSHKVKLKEFLGVLIWVPSVSTHLLPSVYIHPAFLPLSQVY